MDPETARRNVPTGIEQKLFDSLGRTLTTVPEDLTIHKTLGRVLDAKREMFTKGEGFDWATAEALAFGRCFRKAIRSACRVRIRSRHLQPPPRRLGRPER
jgi:2-oxoglutarate dehydrogenase complex dehydrogenase (E1) component-like enzyme